MMKNPRKFVFSFFLLMLGIVFTTNGIAMQIGAKVGVNPWDVLHSGLSNVTPLSIGTVNVLVGVLLVAISWLLGVPPHLGTIVNMLVAGPFIDLWLYLDLYPTPATLWARALLFCCGTFLLGFGTAVYFKANFRYGPRDGLMIALHQKTGIRIGWVRAAIEITVIVIGLLFGGMFGVGTIVSALAVGFLIEFSLWLLGWLGRIPVLDKFYRNLCREDEELGSTND